MRSCSCLNTIWAVCLGLVPLACGNNSTLSPDGGQQDGDEQLLPGTPEGLSAAAGDGMVELSWLASDAGGLVGYNLYWGTGPESYSSIDFIEAPATSFRVEGLENQVTYYFAIDAQDDRGYRSPVSESVSATPLAPDRPPAPVNFFALPGNRQVTLVWRAGSKAPLHAYHAYWGSDPEVLNQTHEAQPDQVSLTVKDLENGSAYYFAMRAEDQAGVLSDWTSVIPAAPGEPEVDDPPIILETDPADQAEGVPLDTLVGIVFSEPVMMHEFFSVSIQPEIGLRDFSWNPDCNEVVFGFQKPLLPGQTYTLEVNAVDYGNNQLEGDTTLSFTTDPTPLVPEACFTLPEHGALDFPPNGNLSFGFSTPMNLDSVTAGFQSVPAFGCTWSWDESFREFQCTPGGATGAGLAPDTTYVVTISGAFSLDGQSLAEDLFLVFSTGDQPDTTAPQVVSYLPEDGEVIGDNNVEIAIAFSEPMDQTWTRAAFTLEGYSVPGYLYFSDPNILRYTFQTQYPSGQEIGWTVDGQARDLAGNPLGTDYSGSFFLPRHGYADCQSMPALDGYVTQSGSVSSQNTEMIVGWRALPGQDLDLYRGFLSFDMSCLPEDTVGIQEARLTYYYSFTTASFDLLSQQLVAEVIDYGSSLEAPDALLPTQNYRDCSGQSCYWVNLGYNSLDSHPYWGASGYSHTVVNSAVRFALENRQQLGGRLQFRLRYQQESDIPTRQDYFQIVPSDLDPADPDVFAPVPILHVVYLRRP